MIVHQEKYGIIEYLDDIPCVVWAPGGYMSGDEFRYLMRKGVEYYQTKKMEIPNLVWLNDSRKIKVVGKKEQRWLEEIVNDQARKNGLKFMAFVLPESFFVKLAVKIYVQSTLKKNENDLTIKTFTDPNKAKEWLKISSQKMVLSN